MKAFVVMFAYLLILLETTSAQTSVKTTSSDKVLCPCVEEAENGNIDRNVGFYFIPMVTDGSKYKCYSIVIRNSQPSPEPGRRRLPFNQTWPGFDERQATGGTGIQSWAATREELNSKSKNLTVIEGFHYRINKKRFVVLEEQKRADVASILAQDDDPNKGFILEFVCLITEGKSGITLKTRKPNPDQKVIELAKKKAKELGVEIKPVIQDKSCANEKQIWSDLNSNSLK